MVKVSGNSDHQGADRPTIITADNFGSRAKDFGYMFLDGEVQYGTMQSMEKFDLDRVDEVIGHQTATILYLSFSTNRNYIYESWSQIK